MASIRMARLSLPGVNRQVTLFLIYSALFHIGFLGIPDVILNFYFISLGYPPETIAILQSIPRIGGLLTGLPVGLMANRIGARRIIIYSTMGVAGTFALLVMSPTLPILILSRFLLGFFYGANQIATAPLIVTLTDRGHGTHVFSYHNVVSMAATAVGSVIGGYLPQAMAGLFPDYTRINGLPGAQTPFAYSAALFIAGVVVVLSAIPLHWLASPTVTLRTAVRSAANSIPWLPLMIFCVPLLLFGVSGGLTFPFYNLFFRTTFDVSDESVGTILSIGWLAMGLVPLANPWWDRRVGRARALGITLSIAALGFLCLGFAPTLALSVIAYAVAASTRNTMQPLFQPLLMDSLSPELHNIAGSVGLVLWNIGWFAATAISGAWQVAFGFRFVMLVVAACVFANAVSVVFIFRRRVSYQGKAGLIS